MNIVCIGSGYVGTVTGAVFAAIGHRVTMIDIDQRKVELLNSGKSPIFEPGLARLLLRYAGTTFQATDSYRHVYDADVIFIGVGTPTSDNGSADLRGIKKATESIGVHLNPHRFTVIVMKSTVPIGTSCYVSAMIEEISGLQAEEHFTVASNPEFLREGYAVEDVLFPDRIIVGTTNEKAKQMLKNLYRSIMDRIGYPDIMSLVPFPEKLHSPKPVYLETDIASAELIKYASNAFLAVKISYINEIARLCEALGADVLSVARGMGQDSRIGDKFLQVSSGWSGSCFPKDTSELLSTSGQYGAELSIVKAAVESNRKMHEYCIQKLQRQLKALNGKQVGILGLTFKPNTDDVRQTQATYIISRLLELGCTISVHDPMGMKLFKQLHPNLPINYCSKGAEVAQKADAIVLLTHWDQYLSLDWERMYHQMRKPYILDTRNFLNPALLRSIGYLYEGIGIL